MRVIILLAAILALLLTGTAFAWHTGGFAGGPVFTNQFWGPTSFRTFGATGFTIVHQPAFVGSVLHPATFWGLQTSRWTTVPAFASWHGFRPAFGGFWW